MHFDFLIPKLYHTTVYLYKVIIAGTIVELSVIIFHSFT